MGQGSMLVGNRTDLDFGEAILLASVQSWPAGA